MDGPDRLENRVHEDKSITLRDEPADPQAAGGEVLYREMFRIAGNDFEHGGEAATRVKALLTQLGFPP